jgi:hypothetical protein
MNKLLLGPAVCALFTLSQPVAVAARDAATPNPVSEAELRESIAVLASDAFAGREPGTPGETKTVAYIAEAFSQAGLIGGADQASSWLAPVALVETVPAASTFSLASPGGKPRPIGGKALLSNSDGIAFNSAAPSRQVAFDGIVQLATGEEPATDIANKLVILAAGDDLRATIGDVARLTARNPAAVLVAVGDQAAFDRATGWVGRSRTTLASQAEPGNDAITGFVTGDTLNALGQAVGRDARGGFQPIRGTIATRNTTRDYTSYNVVARLPGSEPASGAVMFTGHWDHLGTCRPEGAPDRICNGAVDNASGIAVLIAVARRLARIGPFERDIYFVATTAEEKGLLGAYALAENPPVPLDRIAVALNVDTIAISGRDAKVAIIGRGKTGLDAIVDDVARDLGRSVDKSDEANAFIRRQDGWALAQKGVPALMVGGSFSDPKLLEAFLSGDYHGPGDELTDATPLGGAAEDADLHVALGAYFADTGTYRLKPKD